MKRKTYEYLGFRLSLIGWAARLGIDYDILRHRLAKGWTVERAFETPVEESELDPAAVSRTERSAANRQRTKGKVLEYNGERRTVSEWAKKLGIPRVTIDERLRKGYPVGQCIGLEPIKFDYSWRCRKLTYKGETLTTREWADRLHVSLCQFCVRIRKGFPPERLFAEGRRARHARTSSKRR